MSLRDWELSNYELCGDNYPVGVETMSDFGDILEGKCMNFSVRIVNLCRFLTEEKKEYRIADQLFRSGTSIGANVAEAQCAISRNDFVAKLYIALKESNESIYWIDLLFNTQCLTREQYDSIRKDCVELKKLLVTITKSARNNQIATSLQRNS